MGVAGGWWLVAGFCLFGDGYILALYYGIDDGWEQWGSTARGYRKILFVNLVIEYQVNRRQMSSSVTLEHSGSSRIEEKEGGGGGGKL